MRGFAIGIAALAASWAMPATAQVNEMKVHQGKCAAGSIVAGKPLVCDMMVSAVPEAGQLMLIFTEAANYKEMMVAIGGTMTADGSMTVEHVQLEPGKRIAFDGRCEITRKQKHIRAVRCTATERGGTRTVMVDMPGTVEMRP